MRLCAFAVCCPISLTAILPLLLAVHPSVKAANVQELIALAKSSAKPLNYASGGIGSSQTSRRIGNSVGGDDRMDDDCGIGGAFAAPFAALVCAKLPQRVLMLRVGLLIAALSAFNLYQVF